MRTAAYFPIEFSHSLRIKDLVLLVLDLMSENIKKNEWYNTNETNWLTRKMLSLLKKQLPSITFRTSQLMSEPILTRLTIWLKISSAESDGRFSLSSVKSLVMISSFSGRFCCIALVETRLTFISKVCMCERKKEKKRLSYTAYIIMFMQAEHKLFKHLNVAVKKTLYVSRV